MDPFLLSEGNIKWVKSMGMTLERAALHRQFWGDFTCTSAVRQTTTNSETSPRTAIMLESGFLRRDLFPDT